MLKKIALLISISLGGVLLAQVNNQENIGRPKSFIELAQTRYTTKVYDPTKKISDEQIEQLAEILRLTPSSVNSQPWQFVIISDENIKERLANASMGGNVARIKQASHLVVFRGLKDGSNFNAYGGASLGKDKDANVRAWIGHQVYISLGFFLAGCADMGIDSTAMEGIAPDEYDKILNIGNDYETLFAVAIGYRSSDDRNQPNKRPKTRKPKEEVVKIIK